MTLIIIMLVVVNACIWVGIKRGIAHAVKPHECPCQKALESGQGTSSKRVSGTPWVD
jgi:hypothetical protein